ncbi:MAG: WD40 repeat domain-containing protein [Campylobacterota bacterium]|nr:WD40 repeat domain-containing protein [Campylobacterota bacterium]
MLKVFLSIILLSSLLISKDLKPSYVYKASGAITDIVSSDGKIYVATDASGVDIFDLKTKEIIQKVTVPQIKDFMGDIIDAKIYNVDVYNGKVLLTAQSIKGLREVHVFENGKLNTVVNIKKQLFVGKAKFIDDEHIAFNTLGNEMYLYNYKTKKTLWKIDVKPEDATFNSTFADFALNETRDTAVVADESGDLKIVDIQKGKITKVLANKNLDKVFKVDFKNNKIITAGQDGRCVVYDLKNNRDYALREKHWFLIYGAGLSPSGKLGAFSSDENNNVTVFNTKTKQKLFKLTQNLMTLSSILFISESELFVTTDSNKFNYYKLSK